MVDIPNAIDMIRHFAGWADKIEGRWVTPLPVFGHARQAYTIREPLGVIGAITAWNAPDADRLVEARPGARRGQRRRAQAGRGRAADRRCTSRR